METETTNIQYRAYAETEAEAYERALNVVDATFAIFSSVAVRKVRGQRAWDVTFSVTGAHSGRPITDDMIVFKVVR